MHSLEHLHTFKLLIVTYVMAFQRMEHHRLRLDVVGCYYQLYLVLNGITINGMLYVTILWMLFKINYTLYRT